MSKDSQDLPLSERRRFLQSISLTEGGRPGARGRRRGSSACDGGFARSAN
jgi:hypothetical protein